MTVTRGWTYPASDNIRWNISGSVALTTLEWKQAVEKRFDTQSALGPHFFLDEWLTTVTDYQPSINKPHTIAWSTSLCCSRPVDQSEDWFVTLI